MPMSRKRNNKKYSIPARRRRRRPMLLARRFPPHGVALNLPRQEQSTPRVVVPHDLLQSFPHPAYSASSLPTPPFPPLSGVRGERERWPSPEECCPTTLRLRPVLCFFEMVVPYASSDSRQPARNFGGRSAPLDSSLDPPVRAVAS